MMIIPTTQTTIARYAAGLYGVKLGNPTLIAVLSDVNLNSANGVSGLNSVLNSYYAPFASQTSAQVAATVVANAGIVAGNFGLTAANVAAAVAIVTAELNFAAPMKNQGAAIANILAAWSNNSVNDPVYGAAARAWNLKIDQANAHSISPLNTENVAFGAINTEFALTAGNDRLTGTAGDDVFIANFSIDGSTLQSGDVINGGAGVDTLKAILAITPFSITPTITGVENIAITAQSDAIVDSGANNVSGTDSIQLDFGRVSGVKQIWSLDSRADVSVEDVRIQNNEITKDITIVMRDTDPGTVDYAVYFDQNSLRNTSSATSLINLRVLDTNSTNLGLAPLKDSPFGSFTFSYSVGGGPLQVAVLASPAIQTAQTFAQLVVALQAAANGFFVPAGVVTVATGGTYTVPDSVSGNTVTGTEIVLSASGNITFDTTPVGSGWLATETVPAISGLYTSFNTNISSTSALVTSTIILDNVGRGSNSGDLIIGGLSTGETSPSKGVERFDITVEDNSKLSNIVSTNNTLREVHIKNGTTDEFTDAYTTTVANAGNLSVGINNNVASELNSGPQNYEDSAFGFSDVRIIDASTMTGKLAFTAQVSSLVQAKYLNLIDGAPALASADTQAFVYTGGTNDDTMTVTLDQGVTAAVNMATGREDFSFAINGGAGNDRITVNITGNESANWYQNHKANKNLTVDSGSGNDVVTMTGAGAAAVVAGAGDDVVYLDNSGMVSGSAAWMINSSPNLNDPLSGANARGFMYDGRVTVSFSAASVGGGVTAGAADAVPANFTNGFEVVVSIPTGPNFTVTQLSINQAIKAAINGNTVLKALLRAEDGPASSLKITSLIDGVFAAADLQVTVSSADVTTLSSALQTTVLNAFKTFAQDSSATIAAAQTANALTVTNSNAAAGMNTNQVFGSTGTGSTVVAMITQGATAAAATLGTLEVTTFTVSQLLAGESVVINGLTVSAVGGIATAANMEIVLEGGLPPPGSFITVSGAYTPAWAMTAGGAGVVVYTAATVGNLADLAQTGTPGRGTFATVNGTPAAPAVIAATEVFTATFTAMGAAETLTLPDATILTAPLLGWTAAQVAAQVALVVAGGVVGYTVAAVGAVVTYTAAAPGALADTTTAQFVFSGQGNSAISTAESDNTVNLGAGNDVAVLGTGALSNDTVVFTGLNNGMNTIVNFEDTVVASRDLLDFKSYLNNKISLSGSIDSQKAIPVTLNTDNVVEANSVTVLNGVFNTTTNTFAGLTAGVLQAAINSTNTGTANYAGITAATLDALTTYTTAAGANNLVGGVGKAVVMVQNNLNEGEYQVFELTFNGLAANTTRDFTVEVIGTVDFGNTVTFAANLLA